MILCLLIITVLISKTSQYTHFQVSNVLKIPIIQKVQTQIRKQKGIPTELGWKNIIKTLHEIKM